MLLMEQFSSVDQSEFRHQVMTALGPELRGAAQEVDVFIEDHPEIHDVSALVRAFQAHTNSAGHFEFGTRNPHRARVTPHESLSDQRTVVVAGEIMGEVTRKLRAVMGDGHGTLAA